MRQMTLAHQAEFQRYSKKTRREQFLEEMDAVMPWAELFSQVAPHSSKGEMGRKPVGFEILLRVYFLRQWFALSDPGVEDALYESPYPSGQSHLYGSGDGVLKLGHGRYARSCCETAPEPGRGRRPDTGF